MSALAARRQIEARVLPCSDHGEQIELQLFQKARKKASPLAWAMAKAASAQGLTSDALDALRRALINPDAPLHSVMADAWSMHPTLPTKLVPPCPAY